MGTRVGITLIRGSESPRVPSSRHLLGADASCCSQKNRIRLDGTWDRKRYPSIVPASIPTPDIIIIVQVESWFRVPPKFGGLILGFRFTRPAFRFGFQTSQ